MSNDRDPNLPPLEAAISKWLLRCLTSAANAAIFEWPSRTKRDEPLPIRDDLGAEDLLSPIRSLLGKSEIKSNADLAFLLRSEFSRGYREIASRSAGHELSPQGWQEILSKVAVRLRSPLRSWAFCVRVAAGCQFPLDRQLGGRFNLSLRLPAPEGESVFMSGDLTAITSDKARFVVEDLVRFVVGASFALGFAGPILTQPPDMITVTLESDGEKLEVPLHPAVGGLIPSLFFHVPTRLNALEESLLENRMDELVARRLHPLGRVIAARSERATELRNGAKLLFDGLAARDEGTGVTFALMAIEAVLLEKSDSESTLARLTEAVAYRLGDSAEVRSLLRRAVKDIYAARSTFVHTGTIGSHRDSRDFAMILARDVIEKELLAFVDA